MEELALFKILLWSRFPLPFTVSAVCRDTPLWVIQFYTQAGAEASFLFFYLEDSFNFPKVAAYKNVTYRVHLLCMCWRIQQVFFFCFAFESRSSLKVGNTQILYIIKHKVLAPCSIISLSPEEIKVHYLGLASSAGLQEGCVLLKQDLKFWGSMAWCVENRFTVGQSLWG